LVVPTELERKETMNVRFEKKEKEKSEKEGNDLTNERPARRE